MRMYRRNGSLWRVEDDGSVSLVKREPRGWYEEEPAAAADLNKAPGVTCRFRPTGDLDTKLIESEIEKDGFDRGVISAEFDRHRLGKAAIVAHGPDDVTARVRHLVSRVRSGSSVETVNAMTELVGIVGADAVHELIN